MKQEGPFWGDPAAGATPLSGSDDSGGLYEEESLVLRSFVCSADAGASGKEGPPANLADLPEEWLRRIETAKPVVGMPSMTTSKIGGFIMRTMGSLLVAALVAGVGLGPAGCGSPAEMSAQPSVPTGAPVYKVQAGASTISQAGYVCSGNVGSVFRVVWTGDAAAGGYRQFKGAVYTSGRFVSVTPGCEGSCPLEAGDSVSQAQPTPGGQRVTFEATATNDTDGFDFVIDAEPAYFDLLIDGVRRPEQILFTAGTGQMATAAAVPFGLLIE